MKSGDVVQLKTGGPLMTVDRYVLGAGNPPTTVVCVWFDGTELKEDFVPVKSLRRWILADDPEAQTPLPPTTSKLEGEVK